MRISPHFYAATLGTRAYSLISPHYRLWYPGYYAADDCLLVIYVAKKEKASSNAVEKVKSCRASPKIISYWINIRSFVSNFVLISLLESHLSKNTYKPFRKNGNVKPSFLRPRTVKLFQKRLETAKRQPL